MVYIVQYAINIFVLHILYLCTIKHRWFAFWLCLQPFIVCVGVRCI
jgi:hypothetical protein